MSLWSNLWDIVWLFFWSFAFVAYLIAIFGVIGDLFRDRELPGWSKALWLIFLIFVPFITVLVYLVARGRGMTERSMRQMDDARSATDEYVRSVAGAGGIADEIGKAKSLLDAGAITQQEFEAIKAKTLADRG